MFRAGALSQDPLKVKTLSSATQKFSGTFTIHLDQSHNKLRWQQSNTFIVAENHIFSFFLFNLPNL